MKKIVAKYFLIFGGCLLACFLVVVTAGGTGEDTVVSDDIEKEIDRLSNQCWQNREKDPELAFDYAGQGIELAEKYGLDEKLAELYNYSGVVALHYLHKPEPAIIYFNDALNIALRTKDSVQIAYVYNNLGDAFYLTGNVALASEYSGKSLRIFRKLDHKKGMAYGLINLGQIDRFNEDYIASLDCLFRAISIRLQINDSLGYASAHLEVAKTFLEMNQIKDAMEYFRKSRDLHEKLDNKRYMALSLEGLGDVYFQSEKYDSAMVLYTRALDLNLERNYPAGIINCRVGIARIYGKTGEVQKGVELFQTALMEAREAGLSRHHLEVLQAKSDFYKDTEEYQEALRIYEDYVSVYDSIYSEMQYQTMREIKNRFQLSEEMNRINNDLKREQRIQLYAFGIIFMLLLMVFVFIVLFRIKRKLNARLHESNKAKDKIFSIISHDLISPFNALFGASDLLELDLKEGNIKEAENNRRVIHTTITETFKLLNNILFWARSQQNNLVIDPSVFNLSQLLKEVQSLSESQAYSKKISIERQVESSLMVKADKNLVRIVLNNFLSNAIKFTPDNGAIQIFANIENNFVKVSVKDNGVGIAKEKVSKLFKTSDIESTRGTNQESGTGLGLMVCREFIENQGGSVGVTSIEGYGSVFYFTLPLALEGS